MSKRTDSREDGETKDDQAHCGSNLVAGALAGGVSFRVVGRGDEHVGPRVREVRQAVHAGSPAVGFWLRGDDGGYQLDPARTAAIRHAFADVEAQWLAFYRDNLLAGDVRFTIVNGRVGREELTLRVRNAGPQVCGRDAGRVDLSALGEK
jgi:hypothetical protein